MAVRPGKRKATPVTLMGWMELSIAELTSDEAPVAAVMRGDVFGPMAGWTGIEQDYFTHESPGGGTSHYSVGRHPKSAELIYRSLPGGLARPLSLWAGLEQAHRPWDPVMPGEAQALFNAWARRNIGAKIGHMVTRADRPFSVSPWFAIGGTTLPPPVLDERSPEIGRVVESGRAEVEAELRRMPLAFVDGVLYAPSSGPCLHVRFHSTIDDNRQVVGRDVRVSVCPEAALLNKQGVEVFSIGDADAANVAATRKAAGAELQVVRDDLSSIRVYDAAALGFDGPWAALRRAVNTLLSYVGSEAICKFESADLRAYADLKDAFLGTKGRGVPGQAEQDELLLLADDLNDRWTRVSGRRVAVGGADNPIVIYRRYLDALVDAGARTPEGAAVVDEAALRAAGLLP